MGKLSYANQSFRFTPKNDDETKLAKRAALVFDAHTLQWATRNITKAVALRQFADESAEKKFKNYFITRFELPECIPYPTGLKPKDFQLASARHVLTRSPAYVADQAGLGKTITSILCMNAVPGRALMICPPYLKYNWQTEINKWSPGKNIMVVESAYQYSAFSFSDVVILPDSLLTSSKMQQLVRDHKWKWLFVDEAHRFKESSAQRTQVLLGEDHHFLDSFERVVFLSGTPTPNRPIELYPLLNGAAHGVIDGMSLNRFGKTYCDGKQVKRFERGRPVFNWDYSGSSNEKELKAKLRSEFMIRHLKKDVLSELEPKTRGIIYLDQPQEILKYEKEVLKKYSLEEILAQASRAENSGRPAPLGEITVYRRQVGLAKIDPAVEFLNDLLETEKKVVVFAHHIDVVMGLAEKLYMYHPLTVRGGMTAKDKQHCIDLFQTKSKRRLIIGNIDSMGVGNTLTKAKRAVFVESSWTPGINSQAEDRIHRITQKGSVYIQYLILRNSLDEIMLRAVMAKEEKINKII